MKKSILYTNIMMFFLITMTIGGMASFGHIAKGNWETAGYVAYFVSLLASFFMFHLVVKAAADEKESAK